MTDDTVHALREGMQSCLSRGPILGFAMHNVRVWSMAMSNGKVSMKPELCMWDPQTPPIVVQSALMSCLSSGLRDHPTKLLEPIMKYEASVGTENMGNVVSDLTASTVNGASER